MRHDSNRRRLAELALVEEEDEAARIRGEVDREHLARLERSLAECEADRAARLRNMNELERLLKESEADRAARLRNMNELERLLMESEADRAARLEHIHVLEAIIGGADRPRPPALSLAILWVARCRRVARALVRRAVRPRR
jgi:hypothetical protein